jgi:hypothetical protein
VVESRHQCRVKGFDRADNLFKWIANVVRIIDDDHVGATAGEAATKRSTEHPAAGVYTEVRYCGMALLYARRENLLEPARLQSRANVPSDRFR